MSQSARTCRGVRSRSAAARSAVGGDRAPLPSGVPWPLPGLRTASAQRATRTASARPRRAMRASSAGGGVPSGGRGAGRGGRAWVTTPSVRTGAAARVRGRTSRSLESRGIRDVTGAVFRLTVRKPKRNRFGALCGRRGRVRGPACAGGLRGPSCASVPCVGRSREELHEGVRKRRSVSSYVCGSAFHMAPCGALSTVWSETKSGRRAASSRDRPQGAISSSGPCIRSVGTLSASGWAAVSRRSPCSPVRPWAARTASGSKGPGIRRAWARARSVTSQARTGESRTSPEMRSRKAEWAAACRAMAAPVDQPCTMTRCAP